MNQESFTRIERESRESIKFSSVKQAGQQTLLARYANDVPVAIHKFRIGPDGEISMPYAAPAVLEIFGIPPENLLRNFRGVLEKIHPGDRRRLLSAIQVSRNTLEPFICEWRFNHSDKGEIWVQGRSIPETENDGGTAWYGYFHEITEVKRVEQECHRNFQFFENMDRINRAIQAAENIDQMMGNVLDCLLSIFDCDRSWLVYPCDPDADSWRAIMERTKPEYPGSFETGLDFKMGSDVARNMRLLLDKKAPIVWGPGGQYAVSEKISSQFGVRSFIAEAIFPKTGKAWMFGLHQCSYTRTWTAEEHRLFDEIGRRLSDGLTGLLVSRELQVSEERFRQAFEFAGNGMALLSLDESWLRANRVICEMLGYAEEMLRQRSYGEFTHPNDLRHERNAFKKIVNGEIPFIEIEKRYLTRDTDYLWTRQTTSVVRSATGEPQYFVLQIENIDQQRRDEEQIALLSFAINRINESVFLINEDGGFEYVNDKACLALGYGRDELIAMAVPDIDPYYQESRWRAHFKDLKSKGSIILETIHQDKGGNIYPVEVNANYFDYGGRSYNLSLAHGLSERKLAEEALRRSKADLQLALDAARLGDWKWDAATHRAIWSARCKALYGLQPDAEVDYERFLSLVHPEDRNVVENAWTRAVEEGVDIELEIRIVWPDGSLHWTAMMGRVFHASDDSQTLFIAGLTMDITERKIAEEIQRNTSAALKESDERFRQMAGSIQEVFWLTDVEKKNMLYVSPAYEKIWGRSCPDLYADPRQWFESIHPDDRKRVQDAVHNQQSIGEYDIEYRVTRPDGSVRFVHDRAFPIQDRSGSVYRIAGVAQDITARKDQDARIQYLAYHDALTGLPNRTLAMNRLEMAIAQSQRHQQILAVLFLDLDRFKAINDTLGHPTGDELLQQAGARLAEILREEDTIGRVGGDEFLILLQDLTSPQDAAHVTGKVVESFSTPFILAEQELHVSASVGVSLFPRDAKDVNLLVKYADSALYLAKQQGGNTFRFFSSELDARMRARLQTENDLRHAIDRQELFLQYQPQFDQDTGKLTGAEALLRWNHPVRGMVPPAEFIPIAEETGLILPIGEWVLRSACIQAKEWQAKGLFDCRISVNLSRRQLEQADFTDKLRQMLLETGCKPHLLEIEITESSAMNKPEEAIVTLQILHDTGIQLALDDFGTGYSSLAYLKRFPFDRLKIDQSFVAGIPEDSDDIAIVQATIMLARQLRLKVIAEGVETEAQRDFLKDNGCSEMQGYLFGKPLAPKTIAAFARKTGISGKSNG